MRMPGFTAEDSLRNKMRQEYRGYRHHTDLVNPPSIVAQLGLGFGNGVTYPPGDDDCYCCLGWIRCPCGLA